MKIEIELKEFWLDEESELEPALKEHVISQAVQQINKSIKERVEKHVDMEVKRQVEENMYRLINNHIKQVVETEQVVSRYNAKEKVSITQYVKEMFVARQYSDKVEEIVKKISSDLTKEIKTRYDILFASQIVTKLNEQGMLKEDIAKLLLDSPVGN